MPNDEDTSLEVSGQTHDIRVYKLADIVNASKHDGQGDVVKLRVYTIFATAYLRQLDMSTSSGRKEFDDAAYQLLDAYSDPNTYVIGYYNKKTHWLDCVVFHGDTTFPL